MNVTLPLLETCDTDSTMAREPASAWANLLNLIF